MISIIFLLKLVHVNDLLFNEYINDVVEEVNAKEALKSSIFVVQKAAAPKTGVESRQSSVDTIRSSLATSYDVLRRRARVPTFQHIVVFLHNILRHTHKQEMEL